MLLGKGLHKRRALLRGVLRGGGSWRRLLRSAVTTLRLSERACRLAAKIWRERQAFELEAAQRFAWLASEFDAMGASPTVQQLAAKAADDERRHAELCATLSRHFGEVGVTSRAPVVRRVAPAGLERKDALIYEVVALACVTETLSTALLGALVDRASDSLAKRTMHSILRDEVSHSRLGWAYLAEAASARAMEAVSAHLPAMLQSTLSDELFRRFERRSARKRGRGFGSARADRAPPRRARDSGSRSCFRDSSASARTFGTADGGSNRANNRGRAASRSATPHLSFARNPPGKIQCQRADVRRCGWRAAAANEARSRRRPNLVRSPRSLHKA